MKKFIFPLLALFISANAWCCDICGLYMGVRPNDYRNSIGINYSLANYSRSFYYPSSVSTLKHGGSTGGSPGKSYLLDESYQSLQLQFQYYFGDKFYLRGFLPLKDNKQWTDRSLTAHASGIGDPTVMLGYRLFNSKNQGEKKAFIQRLDLMAGVKFPLGKTQAVFNDQVVQEDLQVGSGSYDIKAAVQYVARHGKTGISSSFIGQWNRENLSGYVFGNALSNETRLFYLWQKETRMLMPYAGLYLEASTADHINAAVVPNTGRSGMFLSGGAEFTLGNFSIEGRYLSPLAEKISEKEQLFSQSRFYTGIKFLF